MLSRNKRKTVKKQLTINPELIVTHDVVIDGSAPDKGGSAGGDEALISRTNEERWCRRANIGDSGGDVVSRQEE